MCSPSVTDPLFPNLRTLYWQGIKLIPAVHIAVPSLMSLHLNFTRKLRHIEALQDFLDTVETLCPNIKRYQIDLPRPHLFHDTIRTHMCRQSNLEAFGCQGVLFDADTISHFSQMTTLRSLSFTPVPDVSDWTLPSDSTFVFSTLTHLELRSKSLAEITGLLSCIRLPAVEDLKVTFTIHPSKETVESFIKTILIACSSISLAKIEIRGVQRSRIFGGVTSESRHRLTLEDLRLSIAFINLRHVYINIQWFIGLADDNLLALASAWPHIHSLVINDQWGWRTTGGITLQGLLQLLQKCGPLCELCIAIHTGSFINPPHGFDMGSLTPPSLLTLNLADSPIRSADFPALVDVFVKLGMPGCSFSAWGGMNMEDVEEPKRAWNQVFERVMMRFSGPVGERGSVVEVESG